MTSRRQQVASLPLFSSLSPDQIDAVCQWTEVREVAEGTHIVTEGDHGYFFFVLQDGSAVASREGRELARLGPGDFFGEMAILGEGRRTATVSATSPCVLLAMFGTAFRELQREAPQAAEAIQRAVAERAARDRELPVDGT